MKSYSPWASNVVLVLGYADYYLLFKMHTDAMGFGVSCQYHEGQPRVIGYASCALSYPAHKLAFPD